MIEVKDMDISKMSNEQLVDAAIQFDKQQKEDKRQLDAVKAELQVRGLATIEDRNTKYIRYYTESGSASVTDTQSMDVLNVDRLKAILSEGIWKSKVSEETKTTYKYDKQLEKMLKAVFTDDYSFEYTLEEYLDLMNPKPTDKQKKMLLKKLKGEYVADRKTLVSVFHIEDEKGDFFDVDLWFIYKIKNAELIKAFLPEEFLDATISEIKKCLIVDSKTSITIDYDKE